MKVICITGIDGAGKTTLARNLVSQLQANGVNARYIYGRTVPVLSRLLMNTGRKLFLRKHDAWSEYQEYHASKKQKMHNPILRISYTVSILIDYFVQIWYKLLPFAFSSWVIVLDRYVYDTVISDLTVHLDYSAEQTKRAIERSFRFITVPTLTVLIDLNPEVAFARKMDVPHLDYLTERRNWYLTLAERPEVIKINGEESQQKVLSDMVARLAALLEYTVAI